MKKNVQIYSSLLCGFLSFGSLAFAESEAIEHHEVSEKIGFAKEKSDSIWQQILSTQYSKENLSEIEGPGFFGTPKLLCSKFVSKTFVTEPGDNDKMQEGRSKLIHGMGTVIRAKWVPVSHNAPYRFTGIFESGAEQVLARFSLAKPPTIDMAKPVNNNFTPGMGLKVLLDGRDSLNIMAMKSLDGQKEQNIFEHTFTNVLPPPASGIVSYLLSRSFTGGLNQLGAVDPNPLVLPLKHLASLDSRGNLVDKPFEPFRINFKPTAAAKALMHEATLKDDFRNVLAGKGEGVVLYEIWVSTADSKTEWHVGSLEGTSGFVASQYGDEVLRFKHHTIVKDRAGKPHTEL